MSALQRRGLERDGLLVCVTLLAIAALAAVVVHLAAADAYRDANPLNTDWHGDIGDAAAIFYANARIVAGLACGALLVGWVQSLPPAEQLDGNPTTIRRARLAIRISCDAVVIVLVALNAALVGATIGAYGFDVAGRLAPHGVIEVPAFGLALTLYVRAHRGQLTVKGGLAGFSVAVAMLVIAALVETFLT